MINVGTQRRKKKHVTTQNVNEDKKLTSAIKKFGMHIDTIHIIRERAPLPAVFVLFRCAAPSGHRRGQHVQG